jgi:hypothetical protein
MNDNIPYYDGLVGTLQLKRCTIHHLRYTLYHRTNALAAACPKSQSASVDITQSGSRWRGRSQLCSANLYPRPRIPSDSSQQQHFPPRGCHGGRGVQGQRGDITQFILHTSSSTSLSPLSPSYHLFNSSTYRYPSTQIYSLSTSNKTPRQPIQEPPRNDTYRTQTRITSRSRCS